MVRFRVRCKVWFWVRLRAGVGISKSLAWLAFLGWQIGEPIWLAWLALARYASQISQPITSQYIFPQANSRASRASQAIFVQTILYEFV